MTRHPQLTRKGTLLLLSPAFPPAMGGIERTAAALAGGLGRYSVEVVSGRPQHATGMTPPDHVPVHWAKNEPPGGRRATIELNRLAIRIGLQQRPELVLALHVRTMPAARALARMTGARVLLVIHAKEIREQPGLSRAAVRWADGIVTISRFSRELAEGVGADGAKLTMIHPGVMVPSQRPSPLADRPGPKTIVTVSRLSDWHKGHDVALQAMALICARLPDVRLRIVGDGRLRHALEEIAISLGLDGTVEFLGRIDDTRLAAVLNSAHVFCLLSRTPPSGAAGEGFGIAFVEAGAHGLPVIAGETPGVVDAVRNGETGILVDPTDPAAVARAIESVILDRHLGERLAQGGRAWAEELSWDRVIERYDDLITRLLRDPSSGTGLRETGWLRDLATGPSPPPTA